MPIWGQVANKPRRCARPDSSVTRTAPPHSPPRPGLAGSTARPAGSGSTPIEGIRGQEADQEGGDAHDQQGRHELVLRPSLSPKWPKRIPPSGRDMKPTVKVVKARRN